jgi:hypothetical protein
MCYVRCLKCTVYDGVSRVIAGTNAASHRKSRFLSNLLVAEFIGATIVIRQALDGLLDHANYGD